MKQYVIKIAFILWIVAGVSLPLQAQHSPSVRARKASDNLVERLMRSELEKFQHILADPAKYRVQVLYTEINRDKNNKPSFKQHRYRVDAREYFYPASTVKLAASLLAIEKVNRLRELRKNTALDKYANIRVDSLLWWQTPAAHDSTAPDSLPSIAHYVKKILLVSDNDAHNRLYEFLGKQYFNEQLAGKGFTNFRINHRLAAQHLTPEHNRTTNQVFLSKGGRQLLYYQPMTTASVQFERSGYDAAVKNLRGLRLGTAYTRFDSLKRQTIVQEPKDFSAANYIALETLQELLKTTMFPESVPAAQRFDLTKNDYDFLYRYMSMLPRETRFPDYAHDTAYYDGYVKFAMFGDSKQPIPPSIRIFNKVGNAYGFMIENAYVVDFESGVEFMLSAVILSNTKGTFIREEDYDYDTIGTPFLANVGRVIYKHELARKCPRKPDLTRLKAVVGAEPEAK